MKHVFFIILMQVNLALANNISVIIPFSPGGATDQIWRVIHPRLSQDHGIITVTEYHPGAGGGLGAAAAARRKSPALVFTSASLVLAPLVNPGLDVDLEQWRLLAHAGDYVLVLLSGTRGPNSWNQLRSQCRSRALQYGNSGLGSMTHISVLALFREIGCAAEPIPYKSSGLSLPDLAGGNIDLVMDHPTGTVLGLIGQGRITPLLITGQSRLPMLPTTPTSRELGLSMNLRNWHVLVANTAVSNDQAQRITDAMRMVLSDSRVQQELRLLGVESSGQLLPRDFLLQQRQKLSAVLP